MPLLLVAPGNRLSAVGSLVHDSGGATIDKLDLEGSFKPVMSDLLFK